MIKLILIVLSFNAIAATKQVELSRVNKMSDIPAPLKIIDYKKLALDFDKTVFDFKVDGEYWPLIWIDRSGNNFDEPTLGVYTTIGDIRQGPNANKGAFHESLASMGAVYGASLVGIDKSKQHQLNYVSMLKNYFNRETGWNIMQNNTSPEAGANGGGYGRDWWYDVFPNVLFYAIYEKYPKEAKFEDFARTIADKFYEADKILKGDYQFSYFDYKNMKPVKNWICAQPDVAAGHSWVLYSAYKKFGDKKYLEGAISSMKALASNKINPSYEVLMPFGALMAARLNAEEGTNFDVKKMLDWTFDGTAICREGWGVLTGKWNGYDISGFMGSTVDHGGYGFLMNTYDMAWPLIPLVRYDQSFAKTIAKWMLNAANAAKLAYPAHLPAQHQTIPELASVTKGVIAYEGIAKVSTHPEYQNTTISPVAQGDGPKWINGNPAVTQFSVYGSAHVGIFGSIIRSTNVPGILQLNLLATDSFRRGAYPTYLYSNPYQETKTIKINVGKKAVDMYDTVSGKFVGRGKTGVVGLKLPKDTAAVIVYVPAGSKLTKTGSKLLVNGIVIDFHFQQTKI